MDNGAHVTEDAMLSEARGSFQEFCERLKRAYLSGNSFVPSKLAPQAGGAGLFAGQNISHSAILGSESDSRRANQFLAYVEASRKKFPEVSRKYREFLEKAEEAWKGLLKVSH